MRPATAMRNTVLGVGAAMALVLCARVAGQRVVRDRCLASVQEVPVSAPEGAPIRNQSSELGGKSVGDQLAMIAAGGTWESGSLDANATRPISYRKGDDLWSWSCLDEGGRLAFVATSPRARELTPERYFPAESLPEPRRP